jgi:uroporphyrinogen III methyltransferase / synthase
MTDSERPLAGRRILLTRRAEQAGALEARLTALGAVVVVVPAIEVGPPEDPGPLDEALRSLDRYEWLVFTSTNAVSAVKARLGASEGALPTGLKIASVGPTTSEAIPRAFPGCPISLEPTNDYRAEGLLAAFGRQDPRPTRVLLPVSDRSRPDLAEGLEALGAIVDRPVAYRTVTPPDLASRIREALADGVDLLLLASPSAAQGFAATAGDLGLVVPVATIGPTTAKAARSAGLRVVAVAEPSNGEGLVAAAIRVLAANEP